jgi:hypothetical protein
VRLLSPLRHSAVEFSLGVSDTSNHHPFMKPTRYTDPNRLGDVMALIQVLAQHELAIRRGKRIKELLGKKPTSAATWTDLAEKHREFFRVRRWQGGPVGLVAGGHGGQKAGQGTQGDTEEQESSEPGDRDNFALIWREALPAESKADQNEGKRPPLSSESVAKLLEIAVSLHDREITRKQRLAYLVPLGAVIIAGLFSILVLLIQLYFKMPPSR